MKIAPLLLKTFILSLTIFISFNVGKVTADDELEVSKSFSLFTSQQMQGYTKPLFTSFEESFNSCLFTRAVYSKTWSLAIDISGMGMFIPNSQLTYDAELPMGYGNTEACENAELRDGEIIRNISGYSSQPTIYGVSSTPVFSAPQTHFGTHYDYNGNPILDTAFKSVAFADGNDISMMSGIPTLQLIMGFPTRTELRARFWGLDVQNVFTYYFGFNVNQQINHFIGLFADDPLMGLALNLAYHKTTRSKGIDISSYAFGVHFSKTWEEGITVLAGVQYEDITGTFEAIKSDYDPEDVINSPYMEVKYGLPLKFDIEGFTKFRVLGGASYKTGIVEIHGDIAYASQPIFSLGISFWLFRIGEETVTLQRIEKTETIEKKTTIETIEKKKKEKLKK